MKNTEAEELPTGGDSSTRGPRIGSQAVPGSTAQNTAEIRTGRLLEVRADAGYRTAAEVDLLFDAIHTQLAKLEDGVQHVTAVDWRRCPLMAPQAAKRIAERITETNDRTHRSAAIAMPDAPACVLQFVRVIREAQLPDRKLFFNEAEMIRWLCEVLDTPEQVRLRTFLGIGRSPAPFS